MESAIRVAVAEARDLVRRGMLSELRNAAGLAIAGEAVSARQVLELAESAKPDVFVLSAFLPGESPIRLVHTITANNSINVLIFGHSLSQDHILELLKMGAAGYIREDAPAGTLAKAVNAVHRGEMWVPRRLMARFFRALAESDSKRQCAAATYPCGFSPREGEVFCCLKKGYCNKDIANELCISEKTVKTHLGNIFRKLNVSQRLEAVMIALKRELT
jgi:DNA-binding NarL/FixJ family response regulator